MVRNKLLGFSHIFFYQDYSVIIVFGSGLCLLGVFLSLYMLKNMFGLYVRWGSDTPRWVVVLLRACFVYALIYFFEMYQMAFVVGLDFQYVSSVLIELSGAYAMVWLLISEVEYRVKSRWGEKVLVR